MNELDVGHFLGIYKTRLRMQEEGITNPAPEYKEITRTIVERLSKLPITEKITLDDNTLKDSRGNIIVTFPRP